MITDTTKFLNVKTGDFGLSLAVIKARLNNVGFAAEVSEDTMTKLGYAVVDPSEPPTGDVVTEVTPVLKDGRYVQTFEVRAFNEEELANQLQAAQTSKLEDLKALTEEVLAVGVPFNFGTEEAPKNQHIQVRDGDRANHAGMAAKLQRDPDMSLPFRTYEDEAFMMNKDTITAVGDAAYTGYLAILTAVWTLKDKIHSATKVADLPEIPATVSDFYTSKMNWPAL